MNIQQIDYSLYSYDIKEKYEQIQQIELFVFIL